MMNPKTISKTEATFSSSVSIIDKSQLSSEYEDISESGYLRVDMAPEHSTILGTRYEQPYNILNIYKTESGFNVTLEPVENETPLTYSAIYWRKLNQNPKNNDWDFDADGQFFLVPNQIFSPGEIEMTSVEQNEDYPRHLACIYK